jgi:hypothetical protein
VKKFFLVLLLAAASCKGPAEEIPEDILPKEKMVQILIRIHIAEATVGIKNLPSDSASKLYKSYQNEILKEQAVDDSTYARSYSFYVIRPQLMNEIYGAVVDSLSLRETRGKLD